jgi:hypothetical protein
VFRLTLPAIGILAIIATSAAAQSVSPNGVKTLSPAGAIKPTGTWDLATRAGDFICIAGMRKDHHQNRRYRRLIGPFISLGECSIFLVEITALVCANAVWRAQAPLFPDIDVTATVLTRADSCASAGFVRDDLE